GVGGKIASVSIGGSILFGGNSHNTGVESAGDLGAVKIGHDLELGRIRSGGKLASVTIGGSFIGGDEGTGEISSAGDMGPVTIAKDMFGGGQQGGHISTGTLMGVPGNIASVTIGGSMIGG